MYFCKIKKWVWINITNVSVALGFVLPLGEIAKSPSLHNADLTLKERPMVNEQRTSPNSLFLKVALKNLRSSAVTGSNRIVSFYYLARV